MIRSRKQVFRYLPLLGIVLMTLTAIVGGANIGTIREWFTKASSSTANIVVKTQTVQGEIVRSWHYLAQGGENKDYRFGEVVDRVKSVHPEYVRIDHIYDFYNIVSRGGDGHLAYDWSRLDPILDDIARMGAKPFVSLSYMPPAISRGDVTDGPINWGEWQMVVQKTIEHVSGRGGRNIADVYYEVWNEPDLFGKWKTYGDKNYVDLYRFAAYGARNVSNVQVFKLGGPATTGYYDAWIDSLLNVVDKENLKFDFFSWHEYSRDVGQFIEDGAAADLALKKHPKLSGVEKIISEWGFDPENSPGYDGMYGAAHLVAVAVEIPNWVDKAFIFEVQDGKDARGQEFWGRWGLFSHSDFGSRPKPRFRAMEMLEQLGSDRLILTGQGTWVRGVAVKKGEVTQVLLVNYDPSGGNSEIVPVTFEQLQPGEFKLKQRFLGGGVQTFVLATSNSQLKHQLVMPPSSVVLLELEETKVTN